MTRHEGFIVFDLDNTLCDSNWRDRIAKAENWDLFHSLCIYDDPIPFTITELKYLAGGYQIILSTGRTERHREITKDWLQLNGIVNYELYMRQNDDRRRVSEVKTDVVKYLGADYVKLFVDDNRNTIDVMRKLGINCVHFDMMDSARSVHELRSKVDRL